ncbi:germination protein YpeB [Laceyella tengchongensis]
MYKRMAAILLPIVAVAFIAAAAWGYMEHQDKNSVLIKAENQYQRAFHDLNDRMDRLQGELGKSIALNSRRQLSTSMTNVWRLAYAAQSDIGQLPLTLMPFDSAEKFLSRVGNFAYEVGIRDLDKEPLSDKEWKTLSDLYQQAKHIRDDMATLQSKVINRNLRWMDVELAVASEDKKMDNTIIDGFKKVNQVVQEFPEVDWGPSVNNMEIRQRERVKQLKGKLITPEQAKQRVAYAFGRESTKGMHVTRNKKGDYPTYSVRYEGRNKTEVYTDLTTIDGHIVWMVFDRPVTKKRLTLDQALNRATRFLNRIGYKNMTPISYDEVSNIASFNFVHKEGDVYIYPESLAVKVALDNGEVMGLQADEYVFNKMDWSKRKPKLSATQARKQVNPHLKLTKNNLAVIYDRNGRQVLCHEFLGTINGEQYRLFINADTGEEEYVDRIEKANGNRI